MEASKQRTPAGHLTFVFTLDSCQRRLPHDAYYQIRLANTCFKLDSAWDQLCDRVCALPLVAVSLVSTEGYHTLTVTRACLIGSAVSACEVDKFIWSPSITCRLFYMQLTTTSSFRSPSETAPHPVQAWTFALPLTFSRGQGELTFKECASHKLNSTIATKSWSILRRRRCTWAVFYCCALGSAHDTSSLCVPSVNELNTGSLYYCFCASLFGHLPKKNNRITL